MDRVKVGLRVVDGGQSGGRKAPLAGADEHFRLDWMGKRVSPNTLTHYEAMVRPFLAWAEELGIRRFDDLEVENMRHYRALLATRGTRGGERLRIGQCLTPRGAAHVLPAGRRRGLPVGREAAQPEAAEGGG